MEGGEAGHGERRVSGGERGRAARCKGGRERGECIIKVTLESQEGRQCTGTRECRNQTNIPLIDALIKIASLFAQIPKSLNARKSGKQQPNISVEREIIQRCYG